MAYNPKTNWVLNDTVMPADMNRIEQGIADVDTNKRDKSDVIPVNKGGTGQTTAATALAALFGISNQATVLNSGDDLNSCKSVGIYTWSGTNAVSISNVPEINQGTLVTLPRLINYPSGEIHTVVQIVIILSHRIYLRHLNNASWTVWSELYTSASSSPTIPVSKGGTGLTSINDVLTNWSIQSVADKTVYISPSGNDTTGTGTSSAPYRTLTKALSTIPKNTNGKNIIIDVAVGAYSENVTIKDFTGPITLRVSGSTAATFTSMTVDNCVVIHTGQQMNFSPAANGTGLTLQHRAVWAGDRTIYVGSGAYGIVVKSGSTLQVFQSVTLSNLTSAGMDVYGGGRAYVSSIGGSGSAVGLTATSGGILTYGSASITATVKQRSDNGGRVFSGAQTNIPSY